MLHIRNLSIYLREDSREIIKDLSFSLNPVDKTGLIGEEGNGKSVLLKTIFDRKETEKYCDITGEIIKKNEIIAYLPQSIEEKYLELTTKEYLEKNAGKTLSDYNLFYRTVSDLSFDENLISDELKVRYLSGGEKIKLALFSQMMKDPTLLLLDEPSNDLDLESVKWLEKFMKETSLPLIFVSHDTRLLSSVANRIIHLEVTRRRSEARHTVASYGYEEYMRIRENQIVTQTHRAKMENEEFSRKVDRYNRVYNSVEHALRNTKNDHEGKNLKDKMHTVKSIGARLEKEKDKLAKAPDYEGEINIFFDDDTGIPNGKTVLDITIKELKVQDRLLSRNISLKITGPEKICIIGKNGAGKTTLIKRLIRELDDLNLRWGYMPQTYFDLENHDVTALEYLTCDHTKEEHSKISLYLAALNFKREEMYRKIKDLSGGQKAKLFFAKMNLDKAQVLILDEPTRNLSPSSQPEIIQALKDFNGAVISVSHDRDFIKQVCTKVLELTPSGLFEADMEDL